MGKLSMLCETGWTTVSFTFTLSVDDKGVGGLRMNPLWHIKPIAHLITGFIILGNTRDLVVHIHHVYV